MNIGTKIFHLSLIAAFGLGAPLLPTKEARATSWDEPFLETVVREADAFGVFKIERNRGNIVHLTRIKHVAGKKPPAKFKLKGFYHLELASVSGGHGPSYEHTLQEGVSYYLYLKQSKNQEVWQLATPTAGIDHFAPDGRIAATYRFSAHDTLVDIKTYEMTHACIFRHLHAQPCDTGKIKPYIDAQLRRPAGHLKNGIDSEPAQRFFEQHVALETAYLLDIPLAEAALEKFLTSDTFHVQISAVRALGKSNSKTKTQRLIAFIQSKAADPTAKVFAVYALEEIGDRSVAPQLQQLEKTLPADEAGLGMNIMDPRIATGFHSSTKDAVTWLLDNWSE